jgi:leader peptidase (prepilin peptidase)/N-methyltransferase
MFLSRRHIVVGLVALILALLALLCYGKSPYTIVVIAEAWVLLGLAVVDLASRRLPDRLLVLGLPLAAVGSLGFSRPLPLAALAGGILGLGAFWLLAKARPGALGRGDIKLAGLIGLLVGFPGVVTALLAGMIMGGVTALALVLSGRATTTQTMAYAPYLVIGAWVAMFGPGLLR